MMGYPINGSETSYYAKADKERRELHILITLYTKLHFR